MEKVNIKKLFLMLFIFVVLAILVTLSLIFLKIHSSSANYGFGENGLNVPSIQFVVGTNKNQRYNQNDLNIIAEGVNYNGLEYQTIRISGLKNKEIENKINTELESVESDFRERVLAASGESSSMYLTSFVNANYSNILSIAFYGSKQNSNYRNEINIHKFLNYDLTTGNHIEIEDLFVPGTDIDLLAQNYIYKTKLYEKFSEKDIFFNSEYWENGKLNYLVDDLDELDFMNEFLKYKNSNKDFYITPNGVSIRYSEDVNDGIVFIAFKDNLDKVVAYDKFVSDESIFEADNIGLKDLYVCSDVTLYSDDSYYVIEDVSSNFRIDARVNIFDNQVYDKFELYKNAIESVKKEISDKKEEFKKKAKENLDMYYLVDMIYTVTEYDPAFYATTSFDSSQRSDDKFIITKQERIYETSLDDFSNWFEDKMISSYTSENYTMDFHINIYLNDEEKEKCKLSEKHDGTVYVISIGEKFNNIESVFVEGVDYFSVITNYFEQYTDVPRNEIEEAIKNHKYHLEQYTIVFDDLENSVSYGAFKPSDFR